MIKKNFIITVLIIYMCMPAYSQSYLALDKIEQSLFGMTYQNQDEKSRIERLEKNIYGTIQNGNIKTRLEHISKDLSADVMGEEISPAKYTEFEEQEDNTVDYPIVNSFERQIFNQEYKNKKLNDRLSNLEQKVFNKTYKNEDLNTRTERLKIALDVQEQKSEIENDYSEYFKTSYRDDETIPQFNNNKTIKELRKYNPNVGKILTALEKKVLKKTYSNEPEESRVERLEENIFNTSFPQDGMESRLERLALAYQATKTSKKYDTNKASQHMATAMQVGMFLLMILAMVL